MTISNPPQGSEDAYSRAVAGEGEFWDNFIAQRLMQGEMPGSIDWRLSFTQFRYNHGWRPLALGKAAINFRLKEIRFILETATRQPGARVLDLGCGAGWLSLELARRGAHVTALDISPTNLALGRYIAEANARNFPYLYQGFAGLPCRLEDFGSVEYRYADLNTVDLPAEEYDAVVVWDSLHHVAELERLLEQVRGALKPGGVFVGVDHSVPTIRTLEYNELVAGWLENLYGWITSSDPEWLFSSVNEAARNIDWGPLAIDYDPTPVPGFDEFSRQLFAEMLEIVRKDAPASNSGHQVEEESPFEDVSAGRLMARLYESFTPVRLNTICPLIDPEQIIPHYRTESERFFQHYLACALVEAGDKAIMGRHTDGQWFLFHMTRERPTAGQVDSTIAGQFADTLKAIRATTRLQEHMEQKNHYISELEAEIERKNSALAQLEQQLKLREQELIKAREPKLPWKKRKPR